MRYEIYTDGSCKGNPGPGGVGAVVYRDGDLEETFSQGYYRTTNNRMELHAIIDVLEKYGDKEKVVIWTDSEYARRGITEWMSGWKRNGWMRNEGGKKKPVKNTDLWKRLDELVKEQVEFKWVKGHANVDGNETADSLAVRASSRGPYIHDKGF